MIWHWWPHILAEYHAIQRCRTHTNTLCYQIELPLEIPDIPIDLKCLSFAVGIWIFQEERLLQEFIGQALRANFLVARGWTISPLRPQVWAGVLIEVTMP